MVCGSLHWNGVLTCQALGGKPDRFSSDHHNRVQVSGSVMLIVMIGNCVASCYLFRVTVSLSMEFVPFFIETMVGIDTDKT
jgi:hypothetical protein